MSLYFFCLCCCGVDWGVGGVEVRTTRVLLVSLRRRVSVLRTRPKIQSKTEDFELDNSTTVVVVETANHKPVDLRRTHTGKPKEWKDEVNEKTAVGLNFTKSHGKKKFFFRASEGTWYNSKKVYNTECLNCVCNFQQPTGPAARLLFFLLLLLLVVVVRILLHHSPPDTTQIRIHLQRLQTFHTSLFHFRSGSFSSLCGLNSCNGR